jgi:UDP-N-acetylglucosamine transferase subunit ALG13
MKNKAIKLGLVCAPGGHFEQMLNLSDLYEKYPHFWMTFKHITTEPALRGEKAYYMNAGDFKRPWTYLMQFPQTLRMFLEERPSHILSTGSGTMVFSPFLLSVLFRTKFIHIDTFSHVRGLTKMGNLLYKLGFPVLTQWESSRKIRAIYIGPVLKNTPSSNILPGPAEHVFVTLGTVWEPFPRLIQSIETLRKEGVIKERVIVQAGFTKFKSDVIEIFDFSPPEKIDYFIRNAKYVVTQESAGIVTKCLKYNKKIIVMPRSYVLKELRSKAYEREDLHIRLEELGYVFIVHNVEEMRTAISKLDSLNVGFKFDNSLAIHKLKELIES